LSRDQGNHEYDWFGHEWKDESAAHPLPLPMFQGRDSGGECGVPTSLHVPLPLWHSTNLGAFHVVSMCTEVLSAVRYFNYTQAPQCITSNKKEDRLLKPITDFLKYCLGRLGFYLSSPICRHGDLLPIHSTRQVNFTQGSPQWLWLLDDLRSVNRSATPWVLFGGHRPMYVDSDFDADIEVR